MKIIIAKNAGYCFGGRDAVNMAHDVAKKEGEVYMLGDIVHNERVVEDLDDSEPVTISACDHAMFYDFEEFRKLFFDEYLRSTIMVGSSS